MQLLFMSVLLMDASLNFAGLVLECKLKIKVLEGKCLWGQHGFIKSKTVMCKLNGGVDRKACGASVSSSRVVLQSVHTVEKMTVKTSETRHPENTQ